MFFRKAKHIARKHVSLTFRLTTTLCFRFIQFINSLKVIIFVRLTKLNSVKEVKT
jgi:hypothetical protein